MGCRALGCVVALWAIAFVSICGAQPPKTSEAPRISVAGRVVDLSGKPLAGARVVLREWSSMRYSDDVFRSEVHGVLAETTSDAQGQFRFGQVESHPFRSFSDRNPWDVVAFAEGQAFGWQHLSAAEEKRELVITIPAGKSIGGRLIDIAGKPIADCTVLVSSVDALGSDWNPDFNDAKRCDLWRSQIAPRAKTDADGRFEIQGLPTENRFVLSTQHPDYSAGFFYFATTREPQPPVEQPSFEGGVQTTVKRNVYTNEFTETLKPAFRVRGHVLLGDTEKQVSNAKITAMWQSQYQFAVADDEGRFELTSLGEPQYQISTTAGVPGYLAVRELVKLEGNRWNEVQLRLPRGETVRGTVVDDQTSKGVAGVGVRYLASEQDDDTGWSAAKTATSDAAGRFEIVVAPGPGVLQVFGGTERHPTHDVPDFWRLREKQSLSPGLSAKIDVVTEKAIDNVRLSVGRGLVIRGRVVDGTGQPIFAAVVRAKDQFGRADREKQTVTDDGGKFELAGFPPHEECQLEIVDEAASLRGAAKVAADPVAAASRVVDLGEIKLGATGTVVGTVTSGGKPVAGARVYLNRHVQRDNREQIETVGQQVVTDDAGRFRFESVEGSSRVSAYAQAEGFTDQGSYSHALVAGQELEIPPIELKSRGSFVAGIVVDPDGKPVPGVTVSAMERNGGSISFGRSGPPKPTEADGRFRLDDLPNVPLQLLAYIQPPANTKDRSIHFPARVNVDAGQTDVRIVLDPKLQRPLP